MKRNVFTFATVAACSVLLALPLAADELDALAGKWVTDRKDDQGRVFKQVIEITRSKFKFQISREGDERVLYAEGDVKVETLGPFKALKFYNIQGGRSPADLQSVDDDRTVVYTLGYNELITAVNFDKERSEPPMVTRYTKAAAETQTLVIEKIVLHKTPQVAEFYLCFEATAGESTKRFNLPDKTYQGTEITVATDLAVPNVRADQTCKFVLKLDDVAGDECTEEMDNKSTGNFTVSASGSQDYKPEEGWTYTIYWRLK